MLAKFKVGPVILYTLSGAAFVLGILVWGWQGLYWLSEGQSINFPLNVFWNIAFGDLPEFQWKGVQKIVHWVLDVNAGIAWILVGMVFRWWAQSESERIDIERDFEAAERQAQRWDEEER